MGTLPRLRSAKAVWPLHLLAACSTLSLASVLRWPLQPPRSSCVLLKEKLKGRVYSVSAPSDVGIVFPRHHERRGEHRELSPALVFSARSAVG